jgi:hypothetical protein
MQHGLILRIPHETYERGGDLRWLTMRAVLAAAGVPAQQVVGWQQYGVTHEGQGGTNPVLDAPIPPPPAGVDPNIAVAVGVPASPNGTPAPSAPAAPPASGDALALLERIDIEWNAAVKLEVQLSARRKQLATMLQRISSLNRDLNTDERLHGDQKDKSDWEVARRWLRDVSAILSKHIKAYDVGDVSHAGKRRWLAETYEQFVAPRRPFEGLEQTVRDYESYRKMLQVLLNNMNAAYAAASQDGEGRAKEVLRRIDVKVRQARAKRG